AHADDVRTRLAAGTVLVLDQVGWVKANAQSVNGMVDEAALPAPVTPATAKGAAVEAAGVLSLLSTRVLGQFDPFAAEAARLMFVAPAVLIAEEAMTVAAPAPALSAPGRRIPPRRRARGRCLRRPLRHGRARPQGRRQPRRPHPRRRDAGGTGRGDPDPVPARSTCRCRHGRGRRRGDP